MYCETQLNQIKFYYSAGHNSETKRSHPDKQGFFLSTLFTWEGRGMSTPIQKFEGSFVLALLA